MTGPSGRRRIHTAWRLGWGETTGAADPATLHPAEAALVESARPQRRAEFATGRQCARIALREIGVEPPDHPILADPHGAPLWQAGVIGSITHTARGACSFSTSSVSE